LSHAYVGNNPGHHSPRSIRPIHRRGRRADLIAAARARGDIAATSALKVMIALALTGCLFLDSRAFLFGDDFNRAYGWVVDSGNEGDLDLSLRRRFDMLERLNQGAGASRTEDIESF
jgi:hypothetical protein